LRVFCNIEFSEYVIARFAGAEFSLLAIGVGSDEIAGVMERLLAALPVHSVALHLGVTDLGHVERGALLGAADHATRAAQSKAPRAWHQSMSSMVNADLPQGAQAWRILIQQALQQGQLTLHRAAVVDSRTGQLLHQELLAQLAPPDRMPIMAGAFMPMVERLRLASLVDRALVEQALQCLDGADEATHYAINLSPQSLKDPVFIEWLAQRLQQMGVRAQRVILEIPAIVLHQVDLLRVFMQHLESSGVGFAIDRVSAPVPQPAAWPGLALLYMKLDAAYVMSLEGEVNIHIHLDALRDFAQGLGIALIATGIANQTLRELAIKVGVDGFQGAAIDALHPGP